ncbi:MAG: zinc-binding alcohol dehydrogenase family protein [Xanthobacteraceae bacterium]|nr:zinc-binding alcohol dehydrogenase family protein [Xanthobacteraceae bacterium]
MSVAQKTLSVTAKAIAATALRVHEKAGAIENVQLAVENVLLTRERDDQVIVEIAAAGVNPSDVKAAIGMMPYAVWPRTPGRDFAGVVVEGPASLVGKKVFGTGGDVGIRRDGTHATHVLLDAAAVTEAPANVSLIEAAGIGVPFVTAWEGFRRTGMPTKNDVVLVPGANGKVGQAAIQIATMFGARTIGVVRRNEGYRGFASGPVEMLNAAAIDVGQAVKDMTGGKGANIAFNTVGDPYYPAATKALALMGKQILIAAINKVVEFDIFAFYRGRHTYYGVDTLAFTAVESAVLMREMAPHFASGKLKPFSVEDRFKFPFSRAKDAYAEVIGSALQRVVLVPEK